MRKGFTVNYKRNGSEKKITRYTQQFHLVAALFMEKIHLILTLVTVLLLV